MTSGETTAALLSVSAEVLPAQRDIRRLIDGRWALWIDREGGDGVRERCGDGWENGWDKEEASNDKLEAILRPFTFSFVSVGLTRTSELE